MSDNTAAPSASDCASGPDLVYRMVAEAIGTLILVAGGIGTAIFDATFPSADHNIVGVGHLGVALAFGLTVVVGAYALGPISGGTSIRRSRWARRPPAGSRGRTPSVTSSPSWWAASWAPR